MFSSQAKIISITSPFMEQAQESFFKKMLVLFSHVFITYPCTEIEKFDI